MFGLSPGAGRPGRPTGGVPLIEKRWAGIGTAFVVGMAAVAYFGAPRTAAPSSKALIGSASPSVSAEGSASAAPAPVGAAPAATEGPTSRATSGAAATARPTSGASSSPSTVPAGPPPDLHALLGQSWQYQLSGPVDTSVSAPLFDIDLFDSGAAAIAAIHADGNIPVCHFSAGTWESWRPDASRFTAGVQGNATSRPGERWLDVRNRAVLEPIMNARLDLCRSRGFSAAEPDNVDGFSQNTGFPLTPSDQQAYNTYLAGAAHARGLTVALKNDVSQATVLQPSFDFAIDENCFMLAQCAGVAPFTAMGKPVFDVEYSLAPSLFCPQAAALTIGAISKHKSLDAYRVAC